jgi:hypothetical protein
VVVACLAAMGMAALALTGLSLPWPLVGDTAVMHYIAQRILDGAAPYRDLFDINFPGVYMVHLAGIGLLGYDEGVVRALDLTVLGLTMVGVVVTLARFGRIAPVTAALIFWLYHLTAGAPSALQRDYLWCLPLAGMTASVAAYSRSGGVRWLMLGGVSVGLAASVKPLSVMLLPVLAGLAWVGSPEGRWRRVTATTAGAVVSAGAVLAWLWAVGGLGAFIEIVWRYLPLYADFDRAPIGTILGRPAVIVMTPWAAIGAFLLWRSRRFDQTTVMLAAGLGFAAASLLLQGKSFGYHGYPFVMFAGALGAAGLPTALEHRRWAIASLGLLLIMNAGLARRGVRYVNGAAIAEDEARVAAVVRLIQPILAQGRSVQVLDDVVGGLHALYRVRAPQATRFLYDFHFFHHVDHPYIRRLREGLLDQLRARRPGGMVIFEHGQPTGGFDRIELFPELAVWLAEEYRLAHEGDAFRVYLARGLDGTAPSKR